MNVVREQQVYVGANLSGGGRGIVMLLRCGGCGEVR